MVTNVFITEDEELIIFNIDIFYEIAKLSYNICTFKKSKKIYESLSFTFPSYSIT